MYVNFFNPSFLRICFNVEAYKITPTPPLRLHTYVASENIPFSTKVFFILLMSAFLFKKLTFFGENKSHTQSNSVRVVLDRF